MKLLPIGGFSGARGFSVPLLLSGLEGGFSGLAVVVTPPLDPRGGTVAAPPATVSLFSILTSGAAERAICSIWFFSVSELTVPDSLTLLSSVVLTVTLSADAGSWRRSAV